MGFKMIYDTRNRQNIAKLADNTKAKTLEWYNYCIKNEVQILVYDTIRTIETQRENVKKGVSKTMKSYHLVGQALDFVPVDNNGKALWSISAYTTPKVIGCINYAKKLGFTWGGDWDNDGNWRDEKFLDAPHLQYNYTGYGKDTFGKKVVSTPSVPNVNTGTYNLHKPTVKSIQTELNARYKAGLSVDGYYGEKTREALLRALKVEMNKTHTKEMGRAIKTLDGKWYVALLELWGNIILSKDVKTSKSIIYILQASLYVNGHTEVGELDGYWGNKTTTALNNFRKKQGFKQDGLCGGSTWKALLEKVNK